MALLYEELTGKVLGACENDIPICLSCLEKFDDGPSD
jgi:hypothetical protein